jgi:hypothetical protein
VKRLFFIESRVRVVVAYCHLNRGAVFACRVVVIGMRR